jgi:hypothetical protein
MERRSSVAVALSLVGGLAFGTGAIGAERQAPRTPGRAMAAARIEATIVAGSLPAEARAQSTHTDVCEPWSEDPGVIGTGVYSTERRACNLARRDALDQCGGTACYVGSCDCQLQFDQHYHCTVWAICY